MRFRSLVAAVALVAPLAFAAEGVREASAPMRHAENDLQPYAHGGVGIRKGSDFERFSVAVEGVSELVTLKILVGDGHENFVEVGTLASGFSNRVFLRTTQEGGHLPLDAAHVADLVGRGVRVVDGENHPILLGEVPHFPDVVEPPPPPPAAPVVTRANLLRPDGTEFGDSRGVVVATHGEHGDSLRVEVGHLAPETAYLVYIGEGDAAVLFADMRTNGEGGAAVGREAAAGQALTDHLPSLADLAGRHVEIRDHEGHAVLHGHVPGADTPHDAEPEHHEAEHHDEASGADVHVVVDLRPDRGVEQFRMDMRDLPRDVARVLKAGGRRPRADVLMDDVNGDLQPVASVRIDRRGRAHLRYSTRRGDGLPLGASTLRELSGRLFEVRVNGVRAVGGSLPTF